ncbi:MAG: hypothetical protein IIY88_01055, partial [Eubacterium sp.]|nr:hypothetical protein [Eubacterium sp.]
MTELEYVLENFDAKFALYKGDRIVLHGSRSYAAGIVEKFGREYGFVGIMSDDPLEGETYLGL